MKKLATTSFIILAFIMQSELFAQKETFNWYFGEGAGITFNPNGINPRFLADCTQTFGYVTACISDKNGVVLFFTDGNSVFGKDHKIMPHSFKFTSYYSNPEGAVIVPVPGRIKSYYLFSTDSLSQSGLWYSVVDMDENFGNGDLEVKLQAVTRNKIESMEVIKHSNKRHIWLVTRRYLSNRFCSYLITENGITDSTISIAGSNTGYHYYINSTYDGSRLATANFNDSSFEVFNFNNSTGEITNPIKLYDPQFVRPLAVEFSFDGSKLYGACMMNGSGSTIYQFNLNLGSAAEIINTKYIADVNNSSGNYETMQIGPDRLIYATFLDSKQLSVIAQPDSLGLKCLFQRNSLDLEGKSSYLGGLPDFLYDYRNYGIDGTKAVCVGDNIYLFAESTDGSIYQWTGPNGFSSNLQNPVITNAQLNNSGFYKIKVTNTATPYEDSIWVAVSPPPVASIKVNGDTILCPGTSVSLEAFPKESGMTYKWSSGEKSSTINVKKNGTYSVILTNSSGCSDTAYQIINIRNSFVATILTQSPIPCEGDSMKLKAGPDGFKYHWSTGDTNQVIYIKKSGVYGLVVESSDGCTDSVKTDIILNTIPVFKIENFGQEVLCKGDTTVLFVRITDTICTYLWSTGSVARTITVKSAGVYSVTVTNKSGCSATDSIAVMENPSMNVTISADGPVEFCTGDSVVLTGSPYGKGFVTQWSNGAKTDKIVVKSTGSYMYYATNSAGCTEVDTIDVKVNLKLDAVIHGKTTICDNESTLLTAQPYGLGYQYHWSTGETTPEINISKPGYYWVVVYLNAKCSDSANIDITTASKPSVSIIPNGALSFCKGDSITLEAVTNDLNNTFDWSTGGKTNKIIAKETGNYSVKVTNTAGCSDTASVYVDAEEIPLAKIDIPGVGSYCGGDTVILKANPRGFGYKYLWSNGDTLQETIAFQSGKYFVTIYKNSNCYSIDSVDLTFFPKTKVQIIGDSILCNSSLAKLRTDKNFDTYKWSTGDTTKEIYINKAGKYFVKVLDSNGCTATDFFEVIREYSINLAGLQDLNFGKVSIISSDKKAITLTNNSNSDVQISRIYVKNRPDIFSITTNPILPAILNTGATIDISVTFKPDTILTYSDSLIVEMDKPCSLIFNSSLNGSGIIIRKIFATVFLPDTISNIGTDNFCIPLRARLDSGDVNNEPLRYSAEIRYDASALKPENISGTIESGDRVINLYGSNIYLANNEVEIGNFCGIVVLAKQDDTPLRITKFEWSDTTIDTKFKNGSLKIKGLCGQAITRIQYLSNILIEIFPNPAEDFIEIKTTKSFNSDTTNNNDDETLKIEIFNTMGTQISTQACSANNKATGGLRINISGLPTGIYFIRINNGVYSFVKM